MLIIRYSSRIGPIVDGFLLPVPGLRYINTRPSLAVVHLNWSDTDLAFCTVDVAIVIDVHVRNSCKRVVPCWGWRNDISVLNCCAVYRWQNREVVDSNIEELGGESYEHLWTPGNGDDCCDCCRAWHSDWSTDKERVAAPGELHHVFVVHKANDCGSSRLCVVVGNWVVSCLNKDKVWQRWSSNCFTVRV